MNPKLYCSAVTVVANAGKPQQQVQMVAVTGDSWLRFQGGGTIEIVFNDKNDFSQFEPGKVYEMGFALVDLGEDEIAELLANSRRPSTTPGPFGRLLEDFAKLFPNSFGLPVLGTISGESQSAATPPPPQDPTAGGDEEAPVRAVGTPSPQDPGGDDEEAPAVAAAAPCGGEVPAGTSMAATPPEDPTSGGDEEAPVHATMEMPQTLN